MIAEKLLEDRKKLEERLRRLTGGANVFVSESDLFAMSCGCIGTISYIQGMQFEDVEIYHEELMNIIEELSLDLGIYPSVSYAQMKPGTFDLERLQAHDLCDNCQKEYAGVGGKPWPDILIFKMDNGGKSDFTSILEYRSSIEELLREISRRPAYVMQFNIFARACGCCGTTAVVRGIFGDEINAKKDMIVSHILELSKELGIVPTMIYSMMVHGTDAVAGISAQQACEGCRTTYEEYEIIPRPDLEMLYLEKG